jgi:hypothetical protein
MTTTETDDDAANHATLVGIFDDPGEAEEAVGDLHQAGFESEDVEMVIRGEDAVMGGEITDALGTKDATDVWYGIFYGGMVGLLLGALTGFIARRGVADPAGRALGAIAGYAAAGVAVGGILGAMYGLWRSEREARKFATRFASGRAIVAVPADNRAGWAEEILRRHHGHDIHCEARDPLHPEKAEWRKLFRGP